MCQENMMVWKKKSINVKLHKLIKIFHILVEQCYCIVGNVGKMQTVKIQELQEQQKRKEQ